MLETMEIFKHLPGGKKEAGANCKECGCMTCMMFALKLSKGQIDYKKCNKIPPELIEKIEQSQKIQQKEVTLGNIKIGGETVMYRHEKTFINPTGLFVKLKSNDKEKLERILNFKIQSIGVDFTLDGVLLEDKDEKTINALKNNNINVIFQDDIKKLQEVKEQSIDKMVEELTFIRQKAIVERDEKYSEPTYVYLKEQDPFKLCSKMSALVCKYASLIITDLFDEAVFTTIITLRQNIFTDPEKPLQVESKIYEFNNPDENALVFLTTNFALTYFAVANELSSIKQGSYLVITPSEGMSVLTAWSAEKITSEIASRVVEASEILNKVKNKRLIIPGLLSDLRDGLEKSLKDWKVIIGPIEAYKLPEFVKNLD